MRSASTRSQVNATIRGATAADVQIAVVPNKGAFLRLGDIDVMPPVSPTFSFTAWKAGTLPDVTNADLGQIIQVGERIAQEARAAGHRHRSEKRTAALHAALEAVGA